MVRKTAIRVIVMLGILTALNWIYTKTLFAHDLATKSPEVLAIRQSADSADIYYFGESSNITFSPADTTRESISTLTSRFYPVLKVRNINKYATHAGIYLGWVRQIPHSARVRAVIITMNLRSFDAAWIHSKLETPLRESLVLAQPYPNLVNRFLLSLQAFDSKTEQQREQDMLNEWRTERLRFPFAFKYRTVADWDFAMAQGTYLKSDGSWDAEKIALACHFIKGYAFNLSESNPRIRDFDAIAAWAGNRKMPVYFNLMSENVHYADSLVGKELVILMRQNRDYLVNRYNKGWCRIVDNLESVAGKDFIDQTWTTEHYAQRGRMRVASILADSLRRDFGDHYRKAF
jgi:hypothetical protein